MPRLTTRIPKYQLHKASGQAVVTLDGRDFYLGEYNSPESKMEYNRLVGIWQVNGRRLPNDILSSAGADSLTINELFLAYWQHAEAYYCKNGKPTTQQHAIRQAMGPLLQLYGKTATEDFGPLALKTVRNAFVERGLSRTTINGYVGCIKRMFRWGTENELVVPRIFEGLRAVSGLRRGRSEAKENAPVKPVSRAYIEKVISLVSPAIAAMIRLQYLTGMRSGEVVLMRSCDIKQSEKVWLYTPSTHKTEHHGLDRPIYLGPQAQAVLRPFLATDQEYLFSPARAEAQRNAQRRAKRETPKWPSHDPDKRSTRRLNGREQRRRPAARYTTVSYRRAISRACQKAGISPWHPHQLRHSAATRIRKEFDIEAARAVLGHHSATVTEIYAEYDKLKAADIMAKIG